MILILEHPVNDPFKYSGKLGYQALKPNWYFVSTSNKRLRADEFALGFNDL